MTTTHAFLRRALAALAAALPLAVLAAPPAAIAVRDDRGTVVHLAAPPRRVVTLLPSLTEMVCALGACDRLVGTDRFSDYPPQVEALPKAGGLDDANVERIVALKPDLVIAASSARIIDRLASLGIPVAALEPKSQADLHRVLAAVSGLLRAGDPEAVWRGIQRRTDAAAAQVPPAWRGKRVYFEVDASPYAAGPASFIGETLARLGLGNIVPPALGPFPKLNPEFVVRAQPDLVLAGAQDIAGMAERPGWSALAALRGHRTCGLDRREGDVLVRPGPRLGEAAEIVVRCLQRVKAPA